MGSQVACDARLPSHRDSQDARSDRTSPVDENNHHLYERHHHQGQNKPQKLSVVLPQSQKSLKTPTIITSANSAAGAALTPSHLFSSFVQLNGHDVSLFTGLPGCTPTSADCLASSANLSSINPFFCGASPFDSHMIEQNQQQQKDVSPEQLNKSGSNQLHVGECNSKPAHPVDQHNNHGATNVGHQHQTAHDRRNQLSKLQLDQLQAANAMILSPLTFLLSPEQESWLRFAGFQQQQQQQQHHHYLSHHHPLAPEFTQVRLNGSETHQAQAPQTHHHHQMQVPHQSNHTKAQDLTNHQHNQRHNQYISPHQARDSLASNQKPTQTHSPSSTSNSHHRLYSAPAADTSQRSSAPQYQGSSVAYDRQSQACVTDIRQIPVVTVDNSDCLLPTVAHQQVDASFDQTRQSLQSDQQQMALLVMRDTPQQVDNRYVEIQNPVISQPLMTTQNQQYQPPPPIGIYNSQLHQQLYLASQQQQQQHRQDIFDQPGTTHHTQNHHQQQPYVHNNPALLDQQPTVAPAKPELSKDQQCSSYISDSGASAAVPHDKVDNARNGYASNQQVLSTNASKECVTNNSSSCGSSLDVSPARHPYPELSADSRDTIDVTTTPGRHSAHQEPITNSSSESRQISECSHQSTIVSSPRPVSRPAPEHPQLSSTISCDTIQEPVKKKSKGGRKKKIISHEELITRKNRSKERNRVAAKRCRQKRKQFLDELRGRIDDLNELNARLQKENSMLKGEIEILKKKQHNL